MVRVKLSPSREALRTGPRDHADVAALARALVAAAPERLVWASNRPHPTARDVPVDDAALVDRLIDGAPDAAARHRILGEDPAAFSGVSAP
jgi:D-galactarolactone isomerase